MRITRTYNPNDGVSPNISCLDIPSTLDLEGEVDVRVTDRHGHTAITYLSVGMLGALQQHITTLLAQRRAPHVQYEVQP
jgi:hypothetical protein